MADQRIGAIRPVGQQVARGASFSHYFGKMQSDLVAMNTDSMSGSYTDVVSGASSVAAQAPIESGSGPNGSTGAFRFNGEYSFYAKHFLPSKTLCTLKGSSQFSVMVWYKHVDVNVLGTTGGSIYYESTSLPGYARIELNISITGLLSAKVRDTESGTAYTVTESEANWEKPLVGEWHLIALSYNADTEKMFLWKNGVVIGTNTETKGPLTDTTPSDIAIGCYIPENTDYNTSIDGFISEVGLFTRALVVQDIERYVDWFKRLSNRVVGHLIPSYTFTPVTPAERVIRMPIFNYRKNRIPEVPLILGRGRLSHYWSLTESVRVSKWGYGTPATMINSGTLKYTSGPYGKSAIVFSGNGGDMVTIPYRPSSDTNSFTDMFWFRIDAWQAGNIGQMFYAGPGKITPTSCSYCGFIRNDTSSTTLSEIYFAEYHHPLAKDIRTTVITNPPISLGKWHHVASVMYPLDTARGYMCIDGVRYPNEAVESFSSWYAPGVNLVLAGHVYSGAPNYIGALQDLAFYTRALSTSEIKEYYDSTKDSQMRYRRIRYTPPPVPQRVCPIIRNSEKGYRASRMRGSMKEFIHG